MLCHNLPVSSPDKEGGIKGRFFNTNLICVHVPECDANEDENDRIYDGLEDIHENLFDMT
ncbi:hypothetical protein CWI37_0005p0090 [Hamiltosporidium tvaerminnensis]|uniref:Uncharacterized protein n=1 Tax=Hamiltosporidium tvaerminnensis TaxID=1176355 RepID=A0A4Q9LCL3_9MICR|nr:hypothetical protein CWI37_0005p0090 [Hamiltosporidium tvaerminnensis]